MRLDFRKMASTALLVTVTAPAAIAQNVRVEVSKRATSIPTDCMLIVPASIEGNIDVPALVREAICKGGGDMMIDYTYVMHATSREKDRKRKAKEETTTYEVFFPTLKSGMRTRGILLLTHRNGVAVRAKELEKERVRTAERLEKEEAKLARKATPAATTAKNPNGLFPLGMYTRAVINREAFGFGRGGAALAIDDFLRTCEFKLARREQNDGRETLVFTFSPRPDAQFSDNQRYITQLTGEVRIDAKDRIVTRLAGWPRSVSATTGLRVAAAPAETPPAVYVEMMRLREGIWLPRVIRLNGADYPTLFDGIVLDLAWTYSNYIHFSIEIKDVKVGKPNDP